MTVSMVDIRYCIEFKYLRMNMVIQLLSTNCGRMQRSAWCIPRARQMFRDALAGKLGKSWWKQNLRMSRDTFNIICNELRLYVQKK